VGAGANLAEALRPVVIERGALKLAVIAVTAVLQHGAEARRGGPGVHRCGPMTLPAALSRCPLPGVPPRVISILDEGDWDAVAAAIERAKEAATRSPCRALGRPHEAVGC